MRTRTTSWRAALLAASTLALADPARAATATVALEGDLAPDGNGVFDGFLSVLPILNDASQVVFVTSLSGTSGGTTDDRAVFRAEAGSLPPFGVDPVVEAFRAGSAATNSFSTPLLDDAGQVAVGLGTSSGLEAILRLLPTTIALFQGVPDVDLNGSVEFYGFPSMNPAGVLAFRVHLTGTSLLDEDDSAIWRATGSGAPPPLTRIEREGLTTSNELYNGLSIFQLQRPVSGVGGGVAYVDFDRIQRSSTTMVSPVTPVPDANGVFSSMAGVDLNSAGQVSFTGFLAETAAAGHDDIGIFVASEPSTPLTTIAREGDPAPEGTFANLQILLDGNLIEAAGTGQIDDAGRVAFAAGLSGTSGGTSDDSGIFLGAGGPLTTIAQEGDAAPDGGTYQDLLYTRLYLHHEAGIVAFEADTTSTNGIFLGDGQDRVSVVRVGDLLEGSTIASMQLGGPSVGFEASSGAGLGPAGVDPGGQQAVNDLGQVVYHATLTDGREGIFLFTPELHWRSPTSGDWDLASNWTFGISPSIPHPVVIDPAAALKVEGPSAPTIIDSLTIDAASGAALLELDNGGALSINQDLTIGPGGALQQTVGNLEASGFTLNQGSFEYLAGGTADLTEGVLNKGHMTLNGAFITGQLLHNDTDGVLQTEGSIDSLSVANDGSFTATGSLQVIGDVTNNAAMHFQTDQAIHFANAVTNTVTGTIKNSGSTVTFAAGLTNLGAYISDPADNTFSDLTIGETGYLVAGVGDRFIVTGDLLSSSEASVLWDTLKSQLVFHGDPAHVFQHTGLDRGADVVGFTENFAWGSLVLALGESLAIEDSGAPGGALYVQELLLEGGVDQITAILSAIDLYYLPHVAGNAYLGGRSFALEGGGLLAPVVPEPGPALPLLASVLAILRRRWRGGSAMRRRVAVLALAAALVLAAGDAHARASGDFNGDGYDDLAIGAPGEALTIFLPFFGGVSFDVPAIGVVHILYGGPNGVSATGDQVWSQNSPGVSGEFASAGDGFGAALAVGNFDGDAYDDLAIGVPDEDLAGLVVDTGVVHVLYGSRAGLTAQRDQTFRQLFPFSFFPGTSALPVGASFVRDGNRFGFALAAGDFDGNGVDDLAVGAPGTDPIVDGLRRRDHGVVVAIFGQANIGLSPLGSEQYHGTGSLADNIEEEDAFGFALASGNFDGDGFDDLAVGVPLEDLPGAPDAGQVIVGYGSSPGVGPTIQFFENWRQGGQLGDFAEASDACGGALAAGDLDADGFDDLAIGVQGEDLVQFVGGPVADAGLVHVVYGTSRFGLQPEGQQSWTQNSPGVLEAAEAGDIFGRSLAAGDFDGDGDDDLAVAASGEALGNDILTGVVHVLYSVTGAGVASASNQLWHQDVPGIDESTDDLDLFGSALVAGDFDASGSDDLAIGVPNEDVDAAANAGALHVLYGAPLIPLLAEGSQLWHQDVAGVLGSAEAGDRFGAVLPLSHF